MRLGRVQAMVAMGIVSSPIVQGPAFSCKCEWALLAGRLAPHPAIMSCNCTTLGWLKGLERGPQSPGSPAVDVSNSVKALQGPPRQVGSCRRRRHCRPPTKKCVRLHGPEITSTHKLTKRSRS